VAELYRIHDAPELVDPVLVIGLDGWIDAGYAAANAVGTMLEGSGYVTVATFDADTLLDHRSRRPTMHILDGVSTGLTWPKIELRAAADSEGSEALFLVGAEPDHLWRAFSTAVVDLAHQFGVSEVVSLGAYPAAVPHTRPVRVVATATSADQANRIGTVGGRIDVPAGIHAAIEVAASESGLPAVSLWAQVPHYAAAMPYQDASDALVKALARHVGLAFPAGTLAEDAKSTQARLEELVGNNDEHQAMVRQLEAQYDAAGDLHGPLPTGDDLAAEVEQFLRDQD
jgi:proteasome assembly chaperone (PAC2) family protein